MHEDTQRVDQPAQHQMVAAQQVKGHLRPNTKVFNLRCIECLKKTGNDSCVEL